MAARQPTPEPFDPSTMLSVEEMLESMEGFVASVSFNGPLPTDFTDPDSHPEDDLETLAVQEVKTVSPR